MIRRSAGMLSYASTITYNEPCWRVQVYWPELTCRWNQFHIMLRTTFRVVWSERSLGVGFQLLGFGCGLAWDAADVKATPPAEERTK